MQNDIAAASEADELITPGDLAEMLGRTGETIRRMRKAKKLPPFDVNLTRRTQAWRMSTLRAAGLNLIKPVRPVAQDPAPV